MELPALTGTEKQVAWAEGLRDTYVRVVEGTLGQINGNNVNDILGRDENGDPDTRRERYQERKARAIEIARRRMTEYLTQTEARFWIDNRGSLYDATFRRED